MFRSNVVFALAALLLLGPVQGKRGGGRGGGRGGPRGGGRPGDIFDSTLTCDAAEDVAIPCSSRHTELGFLACRTKPAKRVGEPDKLKTVCADPAAASDTDVCGCCEGECPAECTCECDGGNGWWIEKSGDGKRGKKKRNDDEEEDEDDDAEEGAGQVLICAPKLHAATAVASGRGTCLETCTLPN